MKAIIFGANGQDGYYLRELLASKNIEVIGVSRSKGNWLNGDVGNLLFVESLLKKYQPDYVFHFAATSTTKHEALFENHNAIGTGTLNILECVKSYCPKAKVFLSGSAMQFNNSSKPINEKTPFDTRSPYAIERVYSVYFGRYYRNNFGIKVYVGYFFNHDSPMRTNDHVNQKVVEAVKKISRGSSEKLVLDNLDVKKEFNFAGDIVKAVWILVNQNKIYEAVIGSGKTHSIKDWVKYCFGQKNINWKDYVLVRQGSLSGYKILVSDPRLIMSLGWKPKVNFTRLADLMMKE